MSARPFTAEELARLEAHLLETGRLRDRMLLIVGTNVGYRISELLTLRVSQVLTPSSDIAHEITITRGLLKGGAGVHRRSVRSRRVVLNERARGAIRDYLASLSRIPGADDYLFASRQGRNRPIHRVQAHRILVRLCRACGVDVSRVSTHSLRKTFVRAVYDASRFDLIRTQRIVGHSSPLITARYLESCQSDLDEVVLGLATPARPILPALAC
ncbi:tyrosine recombinase XerC [mine drainage metagenome]|uniref:Tyrosine recombinase XerC n=1 Tax=mine drainage metagenome TaxID=410659 RepID=A0A1J5QUJ2_9ZZZZ